MNEELVNTRDRIMSQVFDYIELHIKVTSAFPMGFPP